MMPVKSQKFFYGSSRSTFKSDLEKGTTKKTRKETGKKESQFRFMPFKQHSSTGTDVLKEG